MYLPNSPKLQSHIQQRHSGPNFSRYYPKAGSKPYIMLELSQVIILVSSRARRRTYTTE